MYFDDKLVKKICDETAISKPVCYALMKKFDSDEQKVRNHIEKRNSNVFFLLADNVLLYFGGEMGYKIKVSKDSKVLLDVSIIFLLLLFFLFPIPTYLVGIVLILFVITNTKFELYNDNYEEAQQKVFEKKTSAAKETKKIKEAAAKVEYIEDENGFYGIRIK